MPLGAPVTLLWSGNRPAASAGLADLPAISVINHSQSRELHADLDRRIMEP
jgi:hypothetical protein